MTINLNKSALLKIADIAKDLGNITLGSVILPYILNRGHIFVIFSGLSISLLFWIVSVWLFYKYDE